MYLIDGSDFSKSKASKPIVYDELKSDGSNKSDFYVAGDRIEHFERNAHGYIRNDIARIKECQDAAVAQQLIDQLNVIPASDLNAGKSDAEILLSAKSKYVQCPAEMTRYIESQLEFRDSQVKASEIEKSDDTIKFDKTDDVVDEV